jgi:hypothetical protein
LILFLPPDLIFVEMPLDFSELTDAQAMGVSKARSFGGKTIEAGQSLVDQSRSGATT